MFRLACEGDSDAIAELYRPLVEHTTISFEATPPDRNEIARRVEDTLRSYPWLACELDGALAGYAYAAPHRARAAYRWSVDTSVYVHERYRRRGVGRGLYQSLLAILSAQGYVNAYAGIALPNPASVALHEAMGFERIGVYRGVGYKLGRWCDVEWWERALQPRGATPGEPRGLHMMLTLPGWNELVRSGEALVRSESAI